MREESPPSLSGSSVRGPCARGPCARKEKKSSRKRAAGLPPSSAAALEGLDGAILAKSRVYGLIE